MVDHIFGVPIQQRADVVIATAGGYPKDINLYQTQKTIDNAIYAMKPGGAAIILAECPDIMEPKEFYDWFEYPTFYEMEKAVRANYLISGWVAVRQLEYCQKGLIIHLTRPENKELSEKAGLRAVSSMDEALQAAYDHAGPEATVTVMPQGANTFPILESPDGD
jgi:nickel-dependent lactate racemase